MPEKLVIDIANRQIQRFDEFLEFWKKHKDGRYLITTQNTRLLTKEQRGYYRGVVLPIARAALYDAGWDEITDDETCHEFLLTNFSRTKIVNKSTGEVIEFTQRTRSKDVPEMGKFIDQVRDHILEFCGVRIPEPNEPCRQLAILNEYLSWRHATEATN